MEIIRNNKGGDKLCYDGYMYTRKSASDVHIRWECTRRKAYNCNGKVKTDIDVTAVTSTTEHNHGQNFGSIEFLKVRNKYNLSLNKTRGNSKRL